MYAIIRSGGKQYKVSPGELLNVEKLSLKPGEKVVFNEVLCVGKNGEVFIGKPFVQGAEVIGEVLEQGRGRKISVVKFKRRKGYKKKQGHRQCFSTVRIEEIKLSPNSQPVNESDKMERGG